MILVFFFFFLLVVLGDAVLLGFDVGLFVFEDEEAVLFFDNKSCVD